MNKPSHFTNLVTPELEKMATVLPKKKKTVVAYFNGKPIRTRSGKCAWNGVGSAKNAMILHFSAQEYLYATRNGKQSWDSNSHSTYIPYEERKARVLEFRQLLWTMIEFREI